MDPDPDEAARHNVLIGLGVAASAVLTMYVVLIVYRSRHRFET